MSQTDISMYPSDDCSRIFDFLKIGILSKENSAAEQQKQGLPLWKTLLIDINTNMEDRSCALLPIPYIYSESYAILFY